MLHLRPFPHSIIRFIAIAIILGMLASYVYVELNHPTSLIEGNK